MLLNLYSSFPFAEEFLLAAFFFLTYFALSTMVIALKARN